VRLKAYFDFGLKKTLLSNSIPYLTINYTKNFARAPGKIMDDVTRSPD